MVEGMSWIERYSPAAKLERFFSQAQEQLDLTRSRIDVQDSLFDEYQRMRATDEYAAVYEKSNPLVSVCVSTYNRSKLLQERCLASLCAQDYKNIEIIVVGDACTDNTPTVIDGLEDSRIKFFNLTRKVDYPVDPYWRWMVAGTYALNHALTLARGDFITHLDDDDMHASSRVSELLDFICKTRADVVWHPFYRELPTGKWQLTAKRAFAKGNLTTSSVFYHQWFRNIPWDINAYRYREPGDWNRFRKLKYLGARGAFYSKPLLRHFKERNQ